MNLPTTLDVDGWLLAVRTVAYDDPIRTFLLVFVVCLLLWALYMARCIRLDRMATLRKEQELLALKEEKLLRGSKMRKKDRAKWARSHIADLVTSALEDAQDRGELTDAEVSAGYRSLATVWKLPDLRKRKLLGLEEVVKPTNAFANYPPTDKILKEHLSTVKAGIAKRMSFNIRCLLKKPVTIPGPPPAEAQRKLLSLPRPEKGYFFALLTPRKRA